MTDNSLKVEFKGHAGDNLIGLLELPAGAVKAYVLFAHCFTCGKNSLAASRISRELRNLGFGVLRFDFTGLGQSEGDFANTNFSSNVEDLVLAADYLRHNHTAPALLIGHSLGGAAVLQAADQIAEVQAVATIGAPATATHVSHLFSDDLDEIREKGLAQVKLAGRTFTIKKHFLDDISEQTIEHLKNLKKALLVMHSPIDDTVSISEAEKIYMAARHPKSFISLDQANHLLTQSDDAQYVAISIAAWAGRFVDVVEDQIERPQLDSGQVQVIENGVPYQCHIHTDDHSWLADEPEKIKGGNSGPDPYEHLLAALGSCTAVTMRMYANFKKISLDGITITLAHSREHGEDCAVCDEEYPQVDRISRSIMLTGELDAQQRQKMLEIADKCPVHKTLHNKIVIETKLV
ncbi:alpha/beta fold hydrolase [Marinicella sp. W31]|uniref:bifunctional alpha/beta hydrolase/OsmC family protein n=1 Tax=Marinicella sp. W31 TaxID=3023713 RepID=UPI0037567CAA